MRFTTLTFAALIMLSISSCETKSQDLTPMEDVITPEAPTVGIFDPIFRPDFTYSLSGYVQNNGSDSISRVGFCWSNNPNPTINDNVHILDLGSTNVFNYSFEDYNYSTSYYLRAFAENSAGLSYSNEVEFNTPVEPECRVLSIDYDYYNSSNQNRTLTFEYNIENELKNMVYKTDRGKGDYTHVNEEDVVRILFNGQSSEYNFFFENDRLTRAQKFLSGREINYDFVYEGDVIITWRVLQDYDSGAEYTADSARYYMGENGNINTYERWLRVSIDRDFSKFVSELTYDDSPNIHKRLVENFEALGFHYNYIRHWNKNNIRTYKEGFHEWEITYTYDSETGLPISYSGYRADVNISYENCSDE